MEPVMPGNDSPGLPTAPIFIVGCQRSGTTLMRLILDSHPRISSGPETRFLPDLERITGSDWRRLSRYGFSQEDWHRRIADFFGGFQSDYARSRGKARWADKTPLYALHLDFIDKLFPDCQIIHVIRDGRDVVASHRKRWGYRAALRATVKWPRYIERAQEAASRLPESRYLEVRYEDLVGETEKTLRGVMEFLGEPWDDAVLAYDDKQHDVPDHYVQLAADRRRVASTDRAVYGSRVGAHRRELDPVLRTAMLISAGEKLRALGYR